MKNMVKNKNVLLTPNSEALWGGPITKDDGVDSGNFRTDVGSLFQAIRARAWYKGP